MNLQPVTTTSPSQAESVWNVHWRGRALTLARAAWLLIALSATAVLLTALIWNTIAWWNFTEAKCEDARCIASGQAHQQVFGSMHLVGLYYGTGAAVELLPWVLVGAVIFFRKSHDPFAFFFSLGMVLAGAVLLDSFTVDVIDNHFAAFRPLATALSFLALVLVPTWYLFPDGRFVPHSTQWLATAWIGLTILHFFAPGTVLDYESWPVPLPQVIQMLLVLSILLAMLQRYRRVAGPIVRQQIRWVVATFAFYGCLLAPSFLVWQWAVGHPLLNVILKITYLPLEYIGSALAAGGIGISILRHRLWEIDIVINRTLVYGALTASVLGVYVLAVGLLGTAIQGSSNVLVSILATGLVAVLVQPVRDRLQHGVNRLMYGERDDPVTVLSRLGQRLEATIAPDAVLPALVETVAQTLKLPYAAITYGAAPGGEAAASYGQPVGELLHLPLAHQGDVIGQLVVAPRSGSGAFSPADLHLLENIAHQAGMAVHAVSLTTDLQRSRQRLVTAREEERRRLRRDLHDGLGPNLASQGLKLAAIKQLLEADPVSAKPLLDQVIAQNQSTVQDVRRLVYGLRPPALDELGLIAAIRDYVTGMEGNASLQIEITEPSEGLPALPAAVEAAAYRIVLEALTNVIRHAQANRCQIRFSGEQTAGGQALQIEVHDNGTGLVEASRPGIGTQSMRERAEEVGGNCVLEAEITGGTCVRARLPLISS